MIKTSRKIGLLFFALDCLLFSSSFYLITLFRYQDTGPLLLAHLLVALAILIIPLYIVDGYRSTTDMQQLEYATQHLIAVTFSLAATGFALYAFSLPRSHHFSRSTLLLTYLIFLLTSLAYRRSLNLHLQQRNQLRYFLVIGASAQAIAFYEDYTSLTKRHHSLRFIDPHHQRVGTPIAAAIPSSPLVAKMPEQIAQIIDKQCAAIILADTLQNENMMQDLTDMHFSKIPVMPLELFYEIYLQRVHLPVLSYRWLLEDGFVSVNNPVYDKIKRLLDLIAAASVLLITSPLFIILPLFIKRDNGPVLFTQQRVGKGNKPFTMYKFRSMKMDADKGNIYTQENDTRITASGQWLRKLRLDELPQLWNVLRGEMSLIGPRAEWIKCTKNYDREISYYHFRHLVKPGITGWAQVNYPYGANLYDTLRKLEYDLYYVRHHSLILDTKIALKTLYVVCFGKGAK